MLPVPSAMDPLPNLRGWGMMFSGAAACLRGGGAGSGGDVMRISFDLDDTLICYGAGIPCEPRPPWYKRVLTTGEPLRYGARALMGALRSRGCELWVYTTSHRRPRSVKLWLRSYGVRV